MDARHAAAAATSAASGSAYPGSPVHLTEASLDPEGSS